MTMDVREKEKLGLLGAIPKNKSSNKVKFMCVHISF